ncbi:hypothetical protein QOT17_002132 [Balamuthia mandrillaris]
MKRKELRGSRNLKKKNQQITHQPLVQGQSAPASASNSSELQFFSFNPLNDCFEEQKQQQQASREQQQGGASERQHQQPRRKRSSSTRKKRSSQQRGAITSPDDSSPFFSSTYSAISSSLKSSSLDPSLLAGLLPPGATGLTPSSAARSDETRAMPTVAPTTDRVLERDGIAYGQPPQDDFPEVSAEEIADLDLFSSGFFSTAFAANKRNELPSKLEDDGLEAMLLGSGEASTNYLYGAAPNEHAPWLNNGCFGGEEYCDPSGQQQEQPMFSDHMPYPMNKHFYPSSLMCSLLPTEPSSADESSPFCSPGMFASTPMASSCTNLYSSCPSSAYPSPPSSPSFLEPQQNDLSVSSVHEQKQQQEEEVYIHHHYHHVHHHQFDMNNDSNNPMLPLSTSSLPDVVSSSPPFNAFLDSRASSFHDYPSNTNMLMMEEEEKRFGAAPSTPGSFFGDYSSSTGCSSSSSSWSSSSPSMSSSFDSSSASSGFPPLPDSFVQMQPEGLSTPASSTSLFEADASVAHHSGNAVSSPHYSHHHLHLLQPPSPSSHHSLSSPAPEEEDQTEGENGGGGGGAELTPVLRKMALNLAPARKAPPPPTSPTDRLKVGLYLGSGLQFLRSYSSFIAKNVKKVSSGGGHHHAASVAAIKRQRKEEKKKNKCKKKEQKKMEKEHKKKQKQKEEESSMRETMASTEGTEEVDSTNGDKKRRRSF